MMVLSTCMGHWLRYYCIYVNSKYDNVNQFGLYVYADVRARRPVHRQNCGQWAKVVVCAGYRNA